MNSKTHSVLQSTMYAIASVLTVVLAALLLVLGVEFLQVVNGFLFRCRTLGANALGVARVW